MTDKQAVLDTLARLPEEVSLEEISEELEILAAVRRGREDLAADRSKSQEEVRQLFESQVASWTSR